MTDFGGRHIVVTGASTGIGRATANVLVRDGARVTLIARSEDKLREAVATLGEYAGYQVANIGEKAQLISALDAAEAGFGPIDGLFANAGTGGTFSPMTDYSEDNYHALLAVNLHSVFHSIQHVLPGMYARGRGAILVTGSLASE